MSRFIVRQGSHSWRIRSEPTVEALEAAIKPLDLSFQGGPFVQKEPADGEWSIVSGSFIVATISMLPP